MTPTPTSAGTTDATSSQSSLNRLDSVRVAVRKDGHLYKKGGFPRKWHARFYTLENGTLYYYKKEGDAVPRGVLVLAGCNIQMTKDKKLYSFRVSHPNSNRVFDLGTGTESKAKEWVQALREAAQAVEEQLNARTHRVESSGDEVASTFLSSSVNTVLEEYVDKNDGVQVPNQHHDQIQHMMAEFLHDMQDNKDEWRLPIEERGVKTYLPHKASRYGISKGVGVVNHSPFEILDLILRLNKRKTFDHQLMAVNRVEVFDDHTFIDHLTYKPLFPAKGRDFVNLTHWRVLKDGSILLVGQSVKQSDIAPVQSSDIVRAETRLAGFRIVPNADYTSATVTYLVKVSLKGEIPMMIEKQVFRKQALLIDEMRNVLGDNQVNELSGVKTRVANDTHFGLTVFKEETIIDSKMRLMSLQSSVDEDDDHHHTSNQTVIPDEGLPCVPEKYKDTIEKLLNRTKSELQDESAWNFHSEKQGVKAYLKIDGSLTAAKGVGHIPFSVRTILDVILDVSLKKQYDSQLNFGKRLVQLDAHTCIDHLEYNPVFIVAGRDFCNLVHWRILPDQSAVVVCQSVEDLELCPLQEPRVVRGDVHIACWVVKPNKTKGGCDVTFIVKTDLKGSIPSRVASKAASEQPYMISRITDYLKKSPRSKKLDAMQPMTNTIVNNSAGHEQPKSNNDIAASTSKPSSEPAPKPEFVQEVVIPEEGLPSVPAKYKNAIEMLLTRAKSELKDESSWNFHSEKHGVKAFLKIDGSLTAAKGVGHIPFSVRTILDILLDVSLKKQYDAQLAVGKRLADLDAQTKIDHLEYKPVFIVAGRDFCNLVHWRILPDQSAILVCQSVEDLKLCPLQEPRVVRGEVHFACWVVKPNKNKGGCDVTFIVKTDLKGSIPSRVASKAASEQPYMITRITDYLKKSPRSKKFDAMPPMKNTILDAATAQKQAEASAKVAADQPAKVTTSVETSTKTAVTEHSSAQAVASPKVDSDADVKFSKTENKPEHSLSDYVTFVVQFYVVSILLKFTPLSGLIRYPLVLLLAAYFALQVFVGPCNMSPRRKIMIASFGPPDNGNILGTLSIDVTKTLEFIKEQREKHNYHLTITHIVMRALGEGLKQTPSMNGHLVLGNYYPSKTVDVSCLIAVSGGKDLGVATIKNADQQSYRDICEFLRSKSSRLRSGNDREQADRNEMVKMLPTWLLRLVVNFVGWLGNAVGVAVPALGVNPFMFGSCMVTSVGMMGLDLAYAPLTAYTQVPMLVTVGAILEKPVVVNHEIVVRPILTITTTIDHRYADGSQCARMAQSVKRYIEDPSLLL